jgi:hypothetical protein
MRAPGRDRLLAQAARKVAGWERDLFSFFLFLFSQSNRNAILSICTPPAPRYAFKFLELLQTCGPWRRC